MENPKARFPKLLLLASLFLLPGSLAAQVSFIIRGADVSYLQEIEANGGKFYENGTQTDCLKILKDHGFNYVRLRLWNNPPGGYCNLAHTLVLAKRASALGFKLILDFHYSDTWADPAHQTKPAAWQNISFDALKDSVYRFTKAVIESLADQGTRPAIVQLGNEISNGILWPDGSTSNWNNLGALLNEGVSGVRDGEGQGDSIRIMIHVADSLKSSTTFQWFFDNLVSQKVPFDIIGVSYYPWWHGNLSQLKANLDFLADRYKKDILVAETQYPWTLNYDDATNNMVGEASQLLKGYPATVAGQTAFLTNLMDTVAAVPGGRGIGVCYWEPDWISTPTFGSAGENLALFDFKGNALSSMSVFENNPAGIAGEVTAPSGFVLSQNYPNPFNPSTIISYRLPVESHVSLRIFDVLGREVETLVNERESAGEHSVSFNGAGLASGVYFYRIEATGSNGQSFNAVRKMIFLK